MGVCEHFEEARCKSRHAGQHRNWALDVFLRWLVVTFQMYFAFRRYSQDQKSCPVSQGFYLGFYIKTFEYVDT